MWHVRFPKICSVFLFTPAIQAGDWTPVQHPLERYEHIWKSAPFVAATEVTPQSESLAQRYAVTGFARIGNADVVFLFDRKTLNRFSIGTANPTENVELVEVTGSEEMSSLRARIRVQGQVAEIGYDASLAARDSESRVPNTTPTTTTAPQPVPAPTAASQTVSPTTKVPGQTSPNGNKPARIIRRKPIEPP